MRLWFCKYVCLAICAASLLTSQTMGQQSEEPLSIRFSCLSWEGVKKSNLKYLQNGQAVDLRISSAYRTGPYNYTGPNPLVLFKEEKGEDGAIVQVPVASVVIPRGMKDVLFLMVKNTPPLSERFPVPGVEVVVMNDDFGSFPKGAYRVFNLSDYEIGGVFGDTKFTVPGKQYKTIELQGKDELNVRIHFSSKIDGKWVPKINTRWLHRDNERNIVFITDDRSSSQPILNVKTITQYLDE